MLLRRYHLIPGVLLGLLGITASAASGEAVSQCSTLDDAGRGKLVQYIHKKYKISDAIPLEIAKTENVNDRCYQKILFRSVDSHKGVNLILYASPDLRFLSRDLFDVQVDPVSEESKLKQDLLSKISNGNVPSLGASGAPVTVTIFSDFQCPYCSQAAKGLRTEILPTSDGKVRLEFRNFPLPMHSWARTAAIAASCAFVQGDRYFWAFHDFFFEDQRELTADSISQRVLEYASGLSELNSVSLQACMTQNTSSQVVDRDVALGNEVGVTGTPTIFVNGERITGYRPDQLRALIERITTKKNEANIVR